MWIFSWWVLLGLLLGVVIFDISMSVGYYKNNNVVLRYLISNVIAKLIGIWITCKLISVIVLFILHHS